MAKKYGIIQVVKDLLSGNLKNAPADVQKERRAICDSCEVQNTTLKVCTACGCSIPLKVKLKDSSCPMELWGEYIDPLEKS